MSQKNIHGNSKDSSKPQHVYEIQDTDLPDGKNTHKFGISGQELNQNGTSKRANTQVNELNRKTGFAKFIARILRIDIENRELALEYEKDLVKKYKQDNNNLLPPGQQRPNPKE